MKHVIIGAGAAGITAARVIRQLRPADEIVVVSSDEYVYSRCMLHKYISRERDANTLSFVPDDFFAMNRVKWIKGKAVTGMDAAKKTIFGGSESLCYDKLLIATGSDSIIPPIGDLRTAGNVFGLRRLSDAMAIRKGAESARSIVIIGAGLVGLDAAYELLKSGHRPTIVEMADSCLALNLDKHAALAYQQKFEHAGCAFKLGRKVIGTVLDHRSQITHLVFDQGERLECDLVIVAAGVKPAVSFLADSKILYERAVIVDEYLATNHRDVFAAGDVTGIAGIWPNAMKQGETAAKNMCGIPTVYTDVFALKNTVNFFGLATLSIGVLHPEDGDTVQSLEDRRSYKKMILRNGCVAGIVLQGDIANSGFWQYLIKNRINIAALQKPVWKISYADFYELDEQGEYAYPVSREF